MFENILSAIKAHGTIIIHRHHHPDGDAMGSQVGLKHLISENFPEKRVYMVGDDPGRYGFITDAPVDVLPDSLFENALSIILDTSARHLISDERYTLAKATARIDHHIFCEKIADVEVTDTSFESCCGLIAACARELGWRVTDKAATALFTGMVTDSGRFRYDSTSSKTFELAAFLMQQQIDTNEIYRNLYADDFEMMKLRASYVLKIRFTEKNVAYICTTREEMAKMQKDVFTISRGMVGVMADIRGVDIWVNFTETDEGVLCELRSSRFNINPVAVKYGGGGHQKASGAKVPDFDTAMAMLADLDAIMEENK